MRYQAGQPVSVGFICRNKAKEIRKIIPQLAAGTVRPDRVVLCDDLSDDGSPEVFEKLCQVHGLEYRVLSLPVEGPRFRINSLRNAAIRASLDGLVVVLDADLVPARTCLEAHRRMHLNHPGEKLVSTGPRLEFASQSGEGPVNFLWGFESVGQVSGSEGPKLPNWQVTPGSMMGMTQRAVESLGWFDEGYDGFYGFDDVDFMIRADMQGFDFRGDWEAHVIHIPHPRSQIHADSSRNAERFFRKWGMHVVYPEVIRNMGRKPWNETYKELLAGQHPNTVISALPLEGVSARLMLRVLARKAGRRLKSYLGARAG